MTGLSTRIRSDRKALAAAIVLIFVAGWFGFAYYRYSNQILIIPLVGEIVSFQPIATELAMAKLDGNVKAVILEINSPGGYVDSCMEIAAYVEDLGRVKPVIAVMEDVAASGAYYIATFATHIYAHSSTITGSIGVIATWVDMSKYYQQQGINITVWKTGSEKDLGADWRSPTPEEAAQINASVYDTFQKLKDDIKLNRELSPSEINHVSTGATFSGDEAVQLKLIDGIGDIVDGLMDAIRRTGVINFIIVDSSMNAKDRFLTALL